VVCDAMPGSAGGRRFLSVSAAAEVLDLSAVTLYRALHAGEFPAVKVRGRYVIPERALDAMEEAAISTGSVIDAAAWADGQGAA